MITQCCFDKHRRDKLKTVKNKQINDLYQEARSYDDKLFLSEIEYKIGFLKKETKYKYSVLYRYIPFEFACQFGTLSERDIRLFLVGYIHALQMAKYWKDPIKIDGWEFEND